MNSIKTTRPKPSEYFALERELKRRDTTRERREEIRSLLNERRDYLSTINIGQVWMCEQENRKEVYEIESRGLTEKTRPMLVSVCHNNNITVYPLTTSDNALKHCKRYHQMWDGSGWCLTEQLKAFPKGKFWFYMKTIDFNELMEINKQYAEMLMDPLESGFTSNKDLETKVSEPTIQTIESTPVSNSISKYGFPLITRTNKRQYGIELVRDVVDNWGEAPIDVLLNKYRNITKSDIYNIVEVNFAAM